MKNFYKVFLSKILGLILLFALILSNFSVVRANETISSGTLIVYSGHQQSYGNLKQVSDGATLGITGKSKRLEAIRISKGPALANVQGDIVYRTHVQDIGTQAWVKNGALSGTTGRAKRVEAIQIYLTGELAEKYDIYYKVHVQNYGWMRWTKGSATDSGWAGTSGMAFRLEAVKIVMVAKGSTPTETDSKSLSYVSPTNLASISYSGHQQTYGDLATVSNGAVLGVTGRAKRLEAVKINLTTKSDVSGSIRYRSHVEGIGWQDWVSDGEISGTTGLSKRLEAIQIELTGDIAEKCDIYYRLHVQNLGWLGWAKNGQTAGSTGFAYRAEAIQIKIVPKGFTAPGSTSNYCICIPDGVSKDSLISTINNAGTNKSLTTVNSSYNLNSAAGRNLQNAINQYRATGKNVGILMIDLATGAGVQYNSGETFFGASTIKGPYVAAVNKYCANQVDAYTGVMKQTITVSSNEDYGTLRNTFGSSPMQNFINYSGATEISGSTKWPSYNCKTLTKLWVGTYWYFFKEANYRSSWCRGLYTSSKMSFINDTLSSKYTVYTKPGWMTIAPTYAHNDAGIVLSGNHPYLICVLSNGYGYESYLNNIVSALDAVHSDMVQ
jgi:uncharacterized protein YjdB